MNSSTGSHVFANIWTRELMLATHIGSMIGMRMAPLEGSELELEAGCESRFGHLELLCGRLCRRDPVLELVARLRECVGERMFGVAHHPAEDLGGGGEGADG